MTNVEKVNAMAAAFVVARQAAVQTVRDYGADDGGTCNMDSPAFRVARVPDKIVQQAAEKAGVSCVKFTWFGGRRWYWLGGFLRGQGNLRSRMSSAATIALEENAPEFMTVCQYGFPSLSRSPNRLIQKGTISMTTKLKSKVAATKREAVKTPHVIVQARAGTGKTTTMIEGLKHMRGLPTAITPSPQQEAVWEQLALSAKARRVCFVAFNKSIATELQNRVPKGCDAMTMHSMGFRAVRDTYGGVKLDSYRVSNIIAELLEKDIRELRKYQPTLVMAAEKLVGLCKLNLVDSGDRAAVSDLAAYYDVDTNGETEQVLDLVPRVLDRCLDVAADRAIDFNDMIWIPVYQKLPLFQYDLLLVDECLPGWTPVMMGDRSSKPIADVEIGDVVRSYHTGTGRPRNCRVVAVQKIINQKPLVKVKVKHHRKTGKNRKCNFVVCTIDHKVWTVSRGWVEAGQLSVGDTAVVETAAKTSQRGKISKKGRDYLSTIHIGNTKSTGKTYTSGEQFNQIKGGNGKPMPTAQKALLEALGEPWEPEYPVSTGGRQKGYPTCYKIDLANPKTKVAVELDGGSHMGQEAKERDAKKTELLESLGWTVFRFTNREVARDLPGIVQDVCLDGESCPATAEVVEVEETYITDHYVYDITVEDCHNFYANGILVHNCQDLNRCQQELALRAGKRLVLVGDSKQAIYGFAGADSESMSRMKQRLEATKLGCVELPLTVTRRCGKAIVAEAAKIVPDFEAHESNGEGKISAAPFTPTPVPCACNPEGEYDVEGCPECHEHSPKGYRTEHYVTQVNDGDMILCRVNAPLVSQCFKFLKLGRKANINGRDVGQGLISLIRKLKARSIADLQDRLDKWYDTECSKENRKKNPSEARLIALQDRYECLQCFTDGAESVDGVVRKIEQIFSDNGSDGVLFSSVHRAKGLEAQRVFLLIPEGAGIPHPMAKSAWQVEQDFNCLYVAITRSVSELVYVS